MWDILKTVEGPIHLSYINDEGRKVFSLVTNAKYVSEAIALLEQLNRLQVKPENVPQYL